MVIQVLHLAGAADTQDQGAVVYLELVEALKQHQVVSISFAGIDIATSSFVNTSFARLLELMTLDDIKKRIRVTSSTRQINEMIKRRLVPISREFA
jgi:hypothetical protein